MRRSSTTSAVGWRAECVAHSMEPSGPQTCPSFSQCMAAVDLHRARAPEPDFAELLDAVRRLAVVPEQPPQKWIGLVAAVQTTREIDLRLEQRQRVHVIDAASGRIRSIDAAAVI